MRGSKVQTIPIDPALRRAVRFDVVLIVAWFGAILPATSQAETTHLPGRNQITAARAALAPVIDGHASDEAWADSDWVELQHRWLGPEYSSDDFSGRFKVAWTEERIYLLAELTDDILIDRYRDPLVQYWDDDCLEIFIDEDHSGGDHQYNHNAFAYHLSLDNQAIDIGTDKQARKYNDHLHSRWRQSDGQITWEVAINIYTDDYDDDAGNNVPIKLTAGKYLGLMVAYCDNDGSELRENFIGSESVPTGPKDRGWIDAGLFGQLVLAE